MSDVLKISNVRYDGVAERRSKKCHIFNLLDINKESGANYCYFGEVSGLALTTPGAVGDLVVSGSVAIFSPE